MADTYVQAYFHLVFAVKNRDALIKKSWKDELEKYITGIVQSNGHKLIAIGSMPDSCPPLRPSMNASAATRAIESAPARLNRG